MSNNNTPEKEKDSCQADCNYRIFPEPSLWNSALGRRSFIRKTGVASAATVIALNGFKVEVLASSSDCPMADKVVLSRITFFTGEYAAQPYSGSGSSTDAWQSFAFALTDVFDNLPSGSNPTFTIATERMCSKATKSGMTVTVVPENPGTDPTITGPTFNPNTGKYETTISGLSAYGGQTTITTRTTYAGKEC